MSHYTCDTCYRHYQFCECRTYVPPPAKPKKRVTFHINEYTPKKCSNTKRYKGVRAPTCNNGQGCIICAIKYIIKHWVPKETVGYGHLMPE